MFMPNADLLVSVLPALYVGAGILMVMDASFNVAMEPFRALVADLLPSDQRTLGFSIQTILIGLGAVIGSWLPYIFAEFFGVAKTSNPGEVPFNVTLSFYIGAIVFLVTIIWTVITTKEYPPEKHSKDKGPGKGLSEIFTDFADDAQDHEAIGFRAILFLVCLILDVGIYDARYCSAYLSCSSCRQHFRDLSGRCQLGRNNFRCLQRCVCAIRIRPSCDCKKSWKKTDPCVIPNGRRHWSHIHLFRSRSFIPHCLDDRCWYGVGKHSGYALCNIGRFYTRT